jgi:hypothetical protein
MREAGFERIVVQNKDDAAGIIERQPGMPLVYSARITAYKPS